MARQATAPPPLIHPDEIVQSLEAYWYHDFKQGIDLFVQNGERRRASDDAVRSHPEKWCRDGTVDRDKAALREALRTPQITQHNPVISKPEELRDQDAVLCIKAVRANADGDAHLARALLVPVGAKLSKSDPLVKAFADSFVPLVADGLTPANAVRALGNKMETRKDEDGHWIQETDGQKRMTYGDYKHFVVWYAGQWVPRSHPDVKQYPERFEVIAE